MGGGGFKISLQISSDRDDQRIFWGLKFWIPAYFSVPKFGKYFFVWLDLSRDFFGGIENNLKVHGSTPVVVPTYTSHVVLRKKYNPSCKFLRLSDSAWDFWGFNLWSRYFLGF